MRYLPHTEDDIASMLKTIGADNLDDLFTMIPEDCRTKEPLNLPPALNEWELNRHMESLADLTSSYPKTKQFLGAGCYDHYVPATVTALLSRSEFVTAYTPYQPEVSQGTLQGIYEYQTLICRLFGMEVANASMYDGASALAEALLMAIRKTGKKCVAVSSALHPYYREVVKTYLGPPGYDIVELPYTANGTTDVSDDYLDDIAAIAVQSPNFFGCIEPIADITETAHRHNALSVTTFTEPLAYGIYNNPGNQGADIVCGEGRSFGLSQSLGGMTLGIFATRMNLVRNMPGRLVGKTVDVDGTRGFVLTLATREQHIRREKATSNICSNQSLCAMGAAQYLACLGKTGIRDLAKINFNKTEYLKKTLREAGYNIKFSHPTFNEFVVEFSDTFETGYQRLVEKEIVPGLRLTEFYPEMKNCCLVCATETKTKEDIDNFVREVKSCITQ